MTASRITFDSMRGRHEASCKDGYLETTFLVPMAINEGHRLPKLYIKDFCEKPFVFTGVYDRESDDLQFVLSGPSGFWYKMSVQMDAAEDEAYVWKVKKHGETRGEGNFCERDILFVPRSTCVQYKELLVDGRDAGLVDVPTFHSNFEQGKFFRLRLKVLVVKGPLQPDMFKGDVDEEKEKKKVFVPPTRNVFPYVD